MHLQTFLTPRTLVALRTPGPARCRFCGSKVVSQQSRENLRSSKSMPKSALAGALLALMLTANQPSLAQAQEPATGSGTTDDAATPIYFGNGCFWGRQKDFTDVEKRMGRKPDELSAIVGYAGGRKGAGPGNKVCYYYGPKEAVYEELGHAEVVQLQLRGDSQAERRQMEAFADTYFKQFRKTPFGMIRLDPQDMGPAYRNVIGLPGGVRSPLFKVLQERNVNNMELVASSGNDFEDGRASESDKINTVYIVDSDKLPFFKAEAYHQYHNGIGKAFPAEYRNGLKELALKRGLIGPTGCPELRM